MKRKLKISAVIAIVIFSSSVFSEVLTGEWTEGIKRYCQYSNGDVTEISFGAACPRTK
jgi:hypothetical protein